MPSALPLINQSNENPLRVNPIRSPGPAVRKRKIRRDRLMNKTKKQKKQNRNIGQRPPKNSSFVLHCCSSLRNERTKKYQIRIFALKVSNTQPLRTRCRIKKKIKKISIDARIKDSPVDRLSVRRRPAHVLRLLCAVFFFSSLLPHHAR